MLFLCGSQALFGPQPQNFKLSFRTVFCEESALLLRNEIADSSQKRLGMTISGVAQSKPSIGEPLGAKSAVIDRQ
jgi:hypothetical protein